MVTNRFLSLVISLVLPTVVFAKDALRDYSYRVKVPAVAGLSCEQNAAQLALRFAESTKKVASAVSGVCQGDLKGTNNLNIVVVNYKANSEIRPYVAAIEGASYDMNHQGFAEPFATYSQCAAELDAQSQLFQKQTGLNVLAAHCEPSDYDANYGYSLRVEAVGAPANQLYSYIGTANLEESPALVTLAAKVLAESKVAFAHQSDASVFYYAKKPVALQSSHFASYRGDTCTVESAHAQAILQAAGQTQINVICVPVSYGYQALAALSVGWARVYDDMGYTSPKYSSMDECQADRARMLSAANAYHNHVYGALCVPAVTTESRFELHVFGD